MDSEYTDEIEYGRIVVLLKDGSEGSALSITGDVHFGRDKSSDIRIKLASVSREHALLAVDQNGQCSLQHLSKTNPTKLNGEDISGTVILLDGDNITIGERQFIFQTDTVHDSTVKGVLKNVPLQAIDEGITLDFCVKGSNKQVIAEPATAPTCDVISKEVKPLTPKEAVTPKKTVNAVRMKALSTPIRLAIQSHTQALKKDVTQLDSLLASDHEKFGTVSKISILTPLKNAIHARRKSLSKEIQHFESVSTLDSSSTPKRASATSSVSPNSAKKSMKTPLRKAIESRRKSVSSVMIEDAEVKAVLKTPLRKEIQSRRKSYTAVETGGADVAVEAPKSAKRTMKTPLRHEIQARRKSLQAEILVLDDIAASQEEDVGDVIDDSAESPKCMKTPLRRAIESRRKSLRAEMVALEAEVEAPKSGKKAMKTPLRRAIESRRKSLRAEEVVLNDLEATHGDDVDVEDAVSVEENAPKCMRTPLRRAIESRRKSLHDEIAQLEAQEVEIVDEGAKPKSMKTPLRKAIESRRRMSLQAAAGSPMEVVDYSPALDAGEVDDSGKMDIDEDFDDEDAPKCMKTPLRRAIESRRKSLRAEMVALEAEVEAPKSGKKAMKTPLRRAIESRRKSLRAEALVLEEIAAEEVVNQTNEEVDFNAIPKTMKTPLRRAIESRRKSLQNELVELETEVVEVPCEGNKSLKTPLRKAIESRRKSLQVEVESLADIAAVLSSEELSEFDEEVVPKSLKTPLRKAIESRRKSLQAELQSVNDLDESSSPLVESAASTKTVMKTPLRKAIQARRKSHSTVETTVMDVPHLVDDAPKSVKKSMKTPLRKAIESRRKSLQAEDQVIDTLEGDDRAARALQTPLRKAIESHRQTLRDELVVLDTKESELVIEEDLAKDSSKKHMQTPLRKAIESRRKSLQAEVEVLDVMATGSLQVVEDMEGLQAPKSMKTPLRKAIESRRKSLQREMEVLDASASVEVVTGEVDVLATGRDVSVSRGGESASSSLEREISSSCSRFSLTSYAATIEKIELMSPEVCMSRAVDAYIKNPNDFQSPSSLKPLFQRKEEVILSSVMKKGKTRTTSPEDIADIMSILDDSDFDVIEIYSAELVETVGLDAEEAYALSLDAYIQGIEAYFKHDGESVEAQLFADQDDEEEENSAASVPVDPETKRRDQELIECYAAEMTAASHLSSAVAYGIALDAYLADKESFRIQIESQILKKIEQREQDKELIAQYAYEIEENSNMSSDYAYELALEAYFADPESFRSNMWCSDEEWADYDYPIPLSAQKGACSGSRDNEEGPEKPTEKTLEEETDTRPKSLKTPLRKAIESRRKTLQAEVDIIEQIQISDHASDSEESEVMPENVSMKTPLRKAIESRRVSLQNEITVLDNASMNDAVVSEVPMTMRTPLRKAIESRRKSLQEEMEVMEDMASDSEDDFEVKNTPKASKTPLGKAIESRRTSLESEIVELEEQERACIDEESDKLQASAKSLKTPLRDAIESRRQSLEVEIAALDTVIDDTGSESLIDEVVSGVDEDEDSESRQFQLGEVGTKRSPAPEEKQSAKKKCIEEDFVAEEQEEEEEEALAILCDGCDGEFILDEVGLTEVPDGDWFCKDCAASKKSTKNAPKSKKRAAAAAIEETEPPAASKKTGKKSGKTTPIVEVKVVAPEQEEEEALAILCDGCDGEFILDEVGLTEVPDGDWFCEACAASKKSTKKAPKSKKRPAAKEEKEQQPPRKRSSRRT